MAGIEAGWAAGRQCGVVGNRGSARDLVPGDGRRAGSSRGRARGQDRYDVRLAAGNADHAMAREEAAMIIAGVGCRRGADADSIEAVLIEALCAFNIEARDLSLIVTETCKGSEPGIRVCAERRGLQLALVPVAELVRVADRVITRSERAERAKGVPSIAEAAA